MTEARPPHGYRFARTLGWALLAGLAAACSGERPEELDRWQRLAQHPARWSGASASGRGGREFANEGGHALRLVEAGGELWLEDRIERGEWTRHEGLWRVRPAVFSISTPSDGGYPYRLFSAARELTGDKKAARRPEATGAFSVGSGWLTLVLAAGDEPDQELTLRACASHERARDDGTRTIRGRRFSGEGLAVWPGESRELRLDLSGGSALRFATCVEQAHGDDPRESTWSFRVLLDDTELFVHEQRGANEAEWHAVPLPTDGRRDARLRFEVEGPFAYTSFLATSLGPADVGSYGARPWASERPDIVVFLADTFRADNLALYGGPPHLTPNLNRLAEQSIRFRNAWSVATHTLPTHAAMFTGLYPPQARQTDLFRALPDEADTIAEALGRAGYRTGAVTDSAIVSQARGMHQGFEWFYELRSTLDSTLERTRDFLAADDGRPVFLFVQSYDVHNPYRVSEDTRRAHGDTLALDAEYGDLSGLLEAALDEDGRLAARTSETEAALRNLHDLYRGGVIDLDRWFPAFLGELRGRGLLPSGALVFTSDHGEAFGEHDELLHGGVVHEEQLRVPLLIHGLGLAARDVDAPASLIDFAPTVAALARVPRDPRWSGIPWLALPDERPVFAFQSRARDDTTMAVIRGSRKVIVPQNASDLNAAPIVGAYELDADPAERDNLASSERWPAELLRAHAPELRTILTPLLELRRAALDGDQLDELRELGYVGDD